LTSQSINHIICRRADGHSTKQVHGHWAAATCGALPDNYWLQIIAKRSISAGEM